MKRGTADHPKMHELAEELQIPLYSAVGILGRLWDWADKYSRRGDIGKFTNHAIARGITWEGDPDELIRALIEHRWIDKNENCRLIIHDWPEHCEYFIHNHLARLGEFFADGSIPNMSRINQKERDVLMAKYYTKTVSAHRALKKRADLALKTLPYIKKVPKKKETHSLAMRGRGRNWEEVKRKVCLFAERLPWDRKKTAKMFHDEIEEYLVSLGLSVAREYPLADCGDGRKGSIDLMITAPFQAAIELDRLSPRRRSLAKIKASGFPGFVLCREAKRGTP